MVWVPIDVLIDTAYRRVVPLYSFDDRDRPYLVASSVPFEAGGTSFLITAAHGCFRDGRPLPLFVYGDKQPHALTGVRGVWEYHPGQQPDLDVAVIALNPDSAEDLRERHWFSTPDHVAVAAWKTPSIHYLIAGYPGSRNRRRPLKYGLPGRATTLITGEVRSVGTVRGADKTDEHHFALSFPHKIVPKPGGGEFRVPPPYGMSGGGVWRVEIDTVARLANRPLLVGVGVEYHSEQRAIVATRVQAVAPLARDLVDPCTPRTVA